MGGPSSGGSDNQVSGAEAVYTGGQTYSSRQTKSVNKEIADQNKENRESRKNIVEKIFDQTLLGRATKAISNTKFVKDSNYKSRVDFAKKTGKFTDTDLNSREFVLSSGFKNQLDSLGYSQRNPRTGRDEGPENKKSTEQPKVASQMNNTDVKSDLITADKTAPTDVEMTDDEYNVSTNRRGRRRTVLSSITGDTSKATLSKKTLLGG